MGSSPGVPPPLSQAALTAALAAHQVQAGDLVLLESTASTNDVAVELANRGVAEWTVVSAEHQTSGRGRLGRQWESPRSANLLFSVILRPDGEAAHSAMGWLPLIGGMAVVNGLRKHAQIDVSLKWPNDVVIDAPAFDGSPGPRKLAGLLAERTPDAVVVGVGLNVNLTRDQLPIPTATSVAIESGTADRAELLAAILAAWIELWQQFPADIAQLREQYKSLCATLGKPVRAHLSGQPDLTGTAVEIDPNGHLIIETGLGQLHTVTAADIVHVRPA